MFEYNVLQFLISHPKLTYKGIEWNLNNPFYKKHRIRLFESINEIDKCFDWLAETMSHHLASKTKRIAMHSSTM
jgi:hypothetical protein